MIENVRQSAIQMCLRPKKKKQVCFRFPDRPYFLAPTLNFFSTFKRKFKIREMAKKIIKIRGTIQKLQAIAGIAGNFSRQPVFYILEQEMLFRKLYKGIKKKKKLKKKFADLPTLFFCSLKPETNLFFLALTKINYIVFSEKA